MLPSFKKLKYFVYAAIILLGSVQAAQADPISAAIAAALVSAGVGAVTAGIIGSILTSIIISVGLSLIASALAPTPKQQEASQNIGINSTLQSGGIVSRSFMVGKYMTPGSEYYPARTWGEDGKTPNAYFTRFIILSDLPVDSLSGLIVDGQECTYGGGTAIYQGLPIPEYNKDGKDHLWVSFHDGRQTAVDDFALSQFATDPDYPYTSSMIGYGCAYAIVTALIDPDLFSSFPEYKFEIIGGSFYDPREDSTVGGSGSQRWDDQSTWAVTYNPAVMKYNIIRGIYFGDQWVFGLQGTDAGRLPLDNWFAAMNVCDNVIAYDGTNNVPQFRCGGEIPVNMTPSDVLDELNKADNGRIAESGGIFKTRSGPVGSAVMSFSDADLLTTESKQFEQFPGLEDVINGITATYPEPAQLWTMTDAPSLFDTDLEALDGDRRLTVSLQYNLVPYNDQVQFLMKSALLEGRKFRKHTVIGPPRAGMLEALDVVSWTSTENGYSNKLFTCVPSDQDNLDIGMVLVEVDPSDYDWTPDDDYQTFTPIVITGRPVPSQEMTGWDAAGVQITGPNGRALAAIEIDWGTSGIDGVVGVDWEVYDNNCPGNLVVAGTTTSFSRGTIDIATGITGETHYQVRGRYVPMYNNRTTEWSDLINVLTPKSQMIGDDLADEILTYAKFAGTITPVQLSDDGAAGSFADVVGTEGAHAVDTNTGITYNYHAGSWEAIGSGAEDFSDLTGTILASQFSTTIRPIEIVTTKPTTGNFQGRQIYLTTDGKVYRFDTTTSPGQYIATVDGADISANTITGGKIVAGAIGTTQLSAQAVTASKLLVSDTSNLVLDANMDDTSYWMNYKDGLSPSGYSSVLPVKVTPGVNSPADWSIKNAMSITSESAAEASCISQIIQCNPGDQFFLSAQLAVVSGNQTLHVGVAFINRQISDFAATNFAEVGFTTSPTVKLFSGSVTAPALATGMYFFAYFAADSGSGTSPPTHSTGYISTPILRRKATGQLIVDGSITATKLTLGSTDNMIIDGAMHDFNAWQAWGFPQSITQVPVANSTWVGDTVFGYITPGGSNDAGIRSLKMSVIPGQSYFLSCGVYQNLGTATHVYLYAAWYDAAGTNFRNDQLANTTSVNTRVQLSGSVVCPTTGGGSSSGAVTMQLLVYTDATAGAGVQIYMDAPTCHIMYTGTLIVDGSITANEMAANSIVAGAIAAGAINAQSIIVSNIIITGHIVDNSVSEAQIVTQSGTANSGSSGSPTVLVGISFSMPSGNGFCFTQLVQGNSTKFTSNPSASSTMSIVLDSATTIYSQGIPASNAPGVTSALALFITGSGSHSLQLWAYDNVSGGGWQLISGWVLKLTSFVK